MSKRNDGDRLTDLELRYMKLERLVDELSDVVATQQRTLDRLAGELHAALSRLREIGDRAEGAIPDEKPPHY
jgi:SlyX protein